MLQFPSENGLWKSLILPIEDGHFHGHVGLPEGIPAFREKPTIESTTMNPSQSISERSKCFNPPPKKTELP